MATELEKLQQSLNKKPSMLMEVSELKDIMVTKVQVKQVLDVLLQKLQEGERRVAELVSQTNSALKSDFDKASKELTEQVNEVKTFVSGIQNEIKSDQRTLSRMFEQHLSDMREDMPEEYDDKELYGKLSELETQINSLNIPKEFDATELNKEIGRLENEVEELKKRPTGSGGGRVTDAAVKAALSRSIVTETPSGVINGSNTDFTVSSTIHAILGFELNSRSIDPGTYTITGQKRMGITFDTALPASYSGKQFTIIYI